MWQMIDIFLCASETYKHIIPEMAQVACIGYGIVLVAKFILFLFGWRRRYG